MAKIFKIFEINEKSQRFDLPFHARLGTEFLIFLTALMTVLCLLSLTASLSLNQLAEKWTSGLENTLTVEIPHSENQNALANKILSSLKDADGIKSVQLMPATEMEKLLSPWLGEEFTGIKDLPLPTIITIDIKQRDAATVKNLSKIVHGIAENAKIDAHEQWLADLLRFTNTLKSAALVIMIAIGLVTSITVAGAVRSRMAIHHTELELLHIMGADDSYIARQFQKYIYWLCGRGVLLGFGICVAGVIILQLVSMTLSETLPKLNLTPLQFLALPLAAVALLFISGWSARLTALKVLRAMP